ncbi:hypothetical protein BGX38DRAFT_1070666, partial [Terfezia claveryi]
RLNLPPGIKIHPVVSVQQVEKAENPETDPWQRGYPRPPPVDGDNIFLAEIIGEQTTKAEQKKYHVRWIEYPLEEAQW